MGKYSACHINPVANIAIENLTVVIIILSFLPRLSQKKCAPIDLITRVITQVAKITNRIICHAFKKLMKMMFKIS